MITGSKHVNQAVFAMKIHFWSGIQYLYCMGNFNHPYITFYIMSKRWCWPRVRENNDAEMTCACQHYPAKPTEWHLHVWMWRSQSLLIVIWSGSVGNDTVEKVTHSMRLIARVKEANGGKMLQQGGKECFPMDFSGGELLKVTWVSG